MRRIFSIVIISCLVSANAGAQEANEMVLQSAYRELLGVQSGESLPYYTVNQGRELKVEGSGLLNEEWEEAIILGYDDKLYRAKVRYDALHEEMQVLSGNNEIKALLPARVKGVRLGEKIFVPHPFTEARKGIEVGFFEVLEQGEASLFKRYLAVKSQGEIHPTMGTSLSKEVTITIVEKYYYNIKSRPAVELRTSKAGVLDALSRRQKAVAQYAKENNLRPKQEKDLIALFSFYNRKGEEK